MGWWIVALVACQDGKDGDLPDDPTSLPTTDPGPDPDPDDTDSDTTDPGDTDEPYVTPPDPCEPLAGLTVTGVDVSQPWHENEARVEVTLSGAASLAVRCTLAGDATEVHLEESATAALAHTVDFAGLLGESTYDCVAAPVCPSTADAPFAFAIDTGAVNSALPAVTTEATGDEGDEYILVNNAVDCDPWPTNTLMVFDREGRPRWWSDTPASVGPSLEFRYHGDDVFVWGGGWEPAALGRPRRLDVFDGEIYDAGDALPDLADGLFHHDGKQLADGRLLTLEDIDIEKDTGGTFRGFQVRRIDPVTDTVDFTYHAQRAYDDGDLPGGFADAWHANWMDIAEVDGDEVLAVSLCDLQQVSFIDVATGSWRGTLGAGGDFAVVDTLGAPLGPIGDPQCQHGLEWDGTRLLAYDNGNQRGYSRITEYELDFTTMTAVLAWTWTEDDWWETTLGDVDRLPSGNILIAMAHAECFSSNPGDTPTIAEVDPVSGDRVWQMQWDDRNTTFYRADFADTCTLFANGKYCSGVGDRLLALSPVF
ncbi:MAG: aryl-sulfate sulfotransferase [Deltaproteobacteria bacterium]|nr:aryl-sulfate sulfotransferase [Deltaproteobacteria bacterium]